MSKITKLSLAAAVLCAVATLGGCTSETCDDCVSGDKSPAPQLPNTCPLKASDACAAKTADGACPTSAKTATGAACPTSVKAVCPVAVQEPFIDGKICEPFFDKLKKTAWAPTFLSEQGDLKTPMEAGKYCAYIMFNEDCRMNGKAGDNLIGGMLSITPKGFFKGDKLYSTRMLGPNIKYEMLFLKKFNSADKITLSGDVLTLFKGDEKMIEFKKIDESDIFSYKN